MNNELPAPKASLSDYLAAERTLLAWIRTGLAMMGFGFVVARFGLFLKELSLSRSSVAMPHSGVSLWFGTALIVVGVAVNAMAGWRHLRLMRELNGGGVRGARSGLHVFSVAMLVALVGAAMAIYLISVRSAAP
jgi:putative membrane protein